MAQSSRRTRRLTALLYLQAVAAAAAAFLPPQFTASAAVPAIVVFGDSTVDSGNNNRVNTVLRSNFRPYGRDFDGGKPTGRFCNGRLATDFISAALGLRPAVPAYLDTEYGIRDFATAVSFASAGTGYDNATADVLSVIPLWKELEYFKEYQERLRAFMGEEEAAATVAGALYIVSAGTNDFLVNYFSMRRRSAAGQGVGEYADFLVGVSEAFVREIYRLGGRRVSLTGLAPIGCLPLERSSAADAEPAGGRAPGACVEHYNAAARAFNGKLREMCARLPARLPGLRLVYTHVYDIFLWIVTNPTLFGFENVWKGCCATGTYEMGYLCNEWSAYTCRDAGKFVFWDAVHPTEKMNLILAYYSLNTSLAELL